MAAPICPTRLISGFRLATALAVALIIAAATGCSPSAAPPAGPLPENVGYLRSSSINESSNLSKLIIFGADTFEIYRTVSLPESIVYRVNRLAKDDYGRIWISYYRVGKNFSLYQTTAQCTYFPRMANCCTK